ncbi:S-layer family protein [Leucobacter luti]|uniref:S-layer homology domain-containing protein n=1 Tax=Leucobacter luti TaxID=340320 RepID=UPI001042D514|nr:S-layer homology domain-containing protein [Leucobacter luti]MCW2288790.1 hypothetical protein [Leucobacter luti]TCK45058.1 S-layer family protein [Leucobacter luti]
MHLSARWKPGTVTRVLALPTVAALAFSLLTLTGGAAAPALAESDTTHSIAGNVSLPGELAQVGGPDVTVRAVAERDASAAAAESVVSAEGEFLLSGLVPGNYALDIDVSGELANSVTGGRYGETDENPLGTLIDLTAGDVTGLEILLEAAPVPEGDTTALPEAAVGAELDPASDEPRAEGDGAAARADDEPTPMDAARRATMAALEAEVSPAERLAQAEAVRNPDDLNQLGEVADREGVAAGITIAVEPQAEEVAQFIPTTRAGVKRSISGVVTIPAAQQSWLSSVEVWLTENATGEFSWVKVDASTGAWNASVAPGQYRIQFVSYPTTANTRLTLPNWYPNTTDLAARKLIDLRTQNVTGVNAALRPAVAVEGKVALPSGFDLGRSRVYAMNSKGQALSVAFPDKATGAYSFGRLPAEPLWFQNVTYDSKYDLQMMQFLRTSGATKHVLPVGVKSKRDLAGTPAKSTISGQIQVTGGLPSSFMRAANVSQQVDGVWFPMYYSWQNFPKYTGIKLGQGTYAVEFTAKTGRDVAKGEWWNKKSSRATASRITLTGSNAATGINGTLRTGSSGQVSPFTDVKSNHKFYKEIAWMYFSKTSTGTTKGDGRYYYPSQGVSREAMAAFMYRMNAPANYTAPTKSPFVDVPKSHKFYKEISWMYTSGLSTGSKTSTGRAYLPKQGVSREAMAAFMFRQYASKDYRAPGYSVFDDVSKSHKFYREISWMYSSGLSTGSASGYKRVYKGGATVTREAMAAFLYRNALNN